MATETPAARRYAADGWRVRNIDYRAVRGPRHGRRLRPRRRTHPHSPICASGESSGGHLALMLAARRPGLTCAISNAGPTDLVHFPAGHVDDVIHEHLAPYVDLRSWSPALRGRRIRQPLLLAYAPYDTVVPYAQAPRCDTRPHPPRSSRCRRA